MKNLFRTFIQLALLGGLVLVLAVVIRSLRGEGGATQLASPTGVSPLKISYPAPVVAPSATYDPNLPYPPPPLPTFPPEIPPTPPPTETLEPFPTPLPTPVVTPIPLAKPPFIPEVVGKAQQPFWIIYWQGNEIWRIDDQGQDRQLLLDTYKSLGQWLTAHPMSGSDCCWNGPRVTVSPNGQQLAIVVVDKDKLTYQDEPFAFSIYLFDIKTQTLKFLSQGASPVWSPDGKRIAFARLIPSGQVTDGSLWIVDVDNGQINALVESDKANPQTRVSLWGWSPDSSQIAYRYNDGMVEKSEVWIKKADNSLSSSFQVPNINENFFTYGFSWMPDGQHILCFVEDYKTPEQPVNMWEVSVITGERKQLTQNLSVAGGRWSPNGKWLAINAVSLYEHQERLYSVWLASADGNQLSRITPTPPQDLIVGWSPDGTRLVLLREGSGMIILSLIDGDIIDLDANLSDKSIAGYSIGALK